MEKKFVQSHSKNKDEFFFKKNREQMEFGSV